MNFSATSGSDITQLLEYLHQSEEDGLRVDRKSATTGCIQITSIHKSKGLEYPVVFLCGLSKDFNLSDSYEKLLCDDSLGLGLYASDRDTRFRHPTIAHSAIGAKIVADTVSEELRVLYVAMTRPKDRLIMTYCVKNAAEDLTRLATLMDYCPPMLHTTGARCMGDWVLFTAMERTDAGELFVNSRKPEASRVFPDVWKISFRDDIAADFDEPTVSLEEKDEIADIDMESVRAALQFRYAHAAATSVPSKQTATQKKGRDKDREVAENTSPKERVHHNWRKPSFVESTTDGRTVGNATHLLMQHIRFRADADATYVDSEIARLVESGFLTQKHAELIDRNKVARFFCTELGRKLCTGNVIREFKFSILDDASDYAPDICDEQVLLQGVVDCALLEADGITVVDFKTDRVTADTIQSASERYRVQVQTYADALHRIYGLPIKQRLLYFFAADQFIEL